jgi:hypothetical protein
MRFEPLENWRIFASRGEPLAAVRSPKCDRNYLLRQFVPWAQDLDLPLFFWNPGCDRLKKVEGYDREIQVDLVDCCDASADLYGVEAAIAIERIARASSAGGIYVLEGALQGLEKQGEYQIENAYFYLNQSDHRKYLVFADESFEIPIALHSMLPALEFGLPDAFEIREKIGEYCQEHLGWDKSNGAIEQQRPIAKACIGLPRAEIDVILDRFIDRNPNIAIETVADNILSYKRDKIAGRGITVLPEPDVPKAAGMDLLDRSLEEIRLLMEPEASQRGLRPPKSVLLWGIPGTGKSLAAKLAAKRIGGSLVAADWNGLVGSTVRESMDNFDYLIEFSANIGNAILFFDEFDKAFAGWDSSSEGGQLGKLAGRLLSWMNDHTEPVVMMATINHLQMLPPEMIRRFEVIHFFGLPHRGALYEVFQVHLDKYFKHDRLEIEDWHVILREYQGCTPAEIGKAVTAVANRRYFRDMRSGNFKPGKPEISREEIIEERQNFIPDAQKRDISDAIAGILNKADYAKPVQGEDNSVFARPPQNLLGIDERKLRKLRSDKSDDNDEMSPKTPKRQPSVRRETALLEDI